MYNYLALGDSYTIGELVPEHENFPNQVVHLLGNKGFEFAKPVIIAKTGMTTDELLLSINEQDIKDTFTLVTLLIGVNNQYRGRDTDNYKEEFLQLLQIAISFAGGKAKNVIVLSIPDWGATPFAVGRDKQNIAKEIDCFNQINKEVAQNQQCRYIEITESTRQNALDSHYLAEDGLHPSGKEYEIWAGRVAAQVIEKVIGNTPPA